MPPFRNLTDISQDDLKTKWVSLCTQYSNDLVLVEKFWKKIERAYTKKKRYYHNFNHLSYIFDLADNYADQIDDLHSLYFAIFYHDVIHKIKRRDNEEKSADLAVKHLKELIVNSKRIEQCYYHILATKTHKMSDNNDRNYFVDFDVAILREPWKVYLSYTKLIRKEYAFYPDFLYTKGRKKVLQHFLDMEHVFKTELFRSKYEEQARSNLQQELELLS